MIDHNIYIDFILKYNLKYEILNTLVIEIEKFVLGDNINLKYNYDQLVQCKYPRF